MKKKFTKLEDKLIQVLKEVSSQLKDGGNRKESNMIHAIGIDETLKEIGALPLSPVDDCNNFRNCDIWKYEKNGCAKCEYDKIPIEVISDKKELPIKVYTDKGDKYKYPIRKNNNDSLPIRIYCEHKSCKKYIKGIEGYNGAVDIETGQFMDLRNDCWYCDDHAKLH